MKSKYKISSPKHKKIFKGIIKKRIEIGYSGSGDTDYEDIKKRKLL